MSDIGVRVPGSTSNLGAGFDCLGLALELWLEVRLVERSGPAKYTGTLAGLRRQDDLVRRILGKRLPKGMRLEVDSEIPVSRGLGSSAAARVAGLALRQLVADRPLDRSAIFRDARQLEGHPDNAGPAVLGGLVLAADRPTVLPFHDELGIALAVPEATVDTEEARAMLPGAFPRETTIAQVRRSAALVSGLAQADGDLIAYGMEDRIAVPYRKDLIPGFDEAVTEGRRAGAYGVTISGSGSALVAVAAADRTETVAQAMAAALDRRDNPTTALTPAVSHRGVSPLEAPPSTAPAT